jgi:threonine dehydratase
VASTKLVDLDAVRQARDLLQGIAVRTPLLPLNVAGAPAQIYVKCENLQPIGAFKIRGAAFAMARLTPSELAGGVLTASAGNMAQAVAWNARRLGVPCTVVAPDTAPDAKLSAVARLGAKVIKVSFDRWWQTFVDRGYPGIDASFIHAFDDERVMSGNGTIALEILEDLPDVDTILVPWGGGGLSVGIASVAKALKPACRVFAVEVEGAAPLAASWDSGVPQVVEYRPSFVDGIGSKTVMPNMLALAKTCLDGSLPASVAEVAAAVRLLAERNRIVAEGAGAVPVAVSLSGRAGGGRVACVISGGNIDLDQLAAILQGEVPS